MMRLSSLPTSTASAVFLLALLALLGAGRAAEGLSLSCAPDKVFDEGQRKCVCDKGRGLKYSSHLNKCVPAAAFDSIALEQDCQRRGKQFHQGRCLTKEYAAKLGGGDGRTAQYAADKAARDAKGRDAERIRVLNAAGYVHWKGGKLCRAKDGRDCKTPGEVAKTTGELDAWGLAGAGKSARDLGRDRLRALGYVHNGWGGNKDRLCRNANNTACAAEWDADGKNEIRRSILGDGKVIEKQQNSKWGACFWGGQPKPDWVRIDENNCCAKAGCTCRNTTSGKNWPRSWAVGRGTRDSCIPKKK